MNAARGQPIEVAEGEDLGVAVKIPSQVRDGVERHPDGHRARDRRNHNPGQNERDHEEHSAPNELAVVIGDTFVDHPSGLKRDQEADTNRENGACQGAGHIEPIGLHPRPDLEELLHFSEA